MFTEIILLACSIILLIILFKPSEAERYQKDLIVNDKLTIHFFCDRCDKQALQQVILTPFPDDCFPGKKAILFYTCYSKDCQPDGEKYMEYHKNKYADFPRKQVFDVAKQYFDVPDFRAAISAQFPNKIKPKE